MHVFQKCFQILYRNILGLNETFSFAARANTKEENRLLGHKILWLNVVINYY